jgi:translation elongation factor EF-1beta
MVDKQSCKIISIVVTICVALAALDIAWTIWGPCRADVMLMLDDSGSVEDSDFDKVRNFVKKLANDESIKDQMDKENVQFGMATFSHCSRWMGQKGEECDATKNSLKYVHNSYSMNEILDNYQRMSSITDVIKALEFVNKQMMEYTRSNSDKILLFMTDGESQGPNQLRQDLSTIKQLADKLKEEGVRIYVIAIGESVDENELEAISSSQCESTEKKGKVCKNTEKFIKKVDDFDGLDDVIGELAGQVCEHQYWMAAIPIVVAILFVVIKLLLDRREANKLDKDAKEMQDFTPGMASNAGRV